MPDVLGSGLALVRFELRDGAGRAHYVHEAERWLQPGENVLVPDYRFPVRKRAPELESGGWTAQVSIDGGALGIYHFNLSESLAELRRQMGPDGELLRDRIWRSDDDDDSLPLHPTYHCRAVSCTLQGLVTAGLRRAGQENCPSSQRAQRRLCPPFYGRVRRSAFCPSSRACEAISL